MNKISHTKSTEAYKTISEVGKALNLTTSTLRFWEKEFKQIKPHVINKRRYYSQKNIQTIKTIKNLVYEKGYTLHGAKKYFVDTIQNENTSTTIFKNKIKQLINLLQSAKTELENNF